MFSKRLATAWLRCAPVVRRLMTAATPSTSVLRRWREFRRNRKAFVSLYVFAAVFLGSIFSGVLANERPWLIIVHGHIYTPITTFYPETEFGGFFESEADYRDAEVQALIKDAGGLIVWPPIRYSANTPNLHLGRPAPSPPSRENILGTDEQARDVLAVLLYGTRTSILFGMLATTAVVTLAVALGALQGFFGGLTDLVLQRLTEIWQGMPIFLVIIILASVVTPSFWLLVVLLSCFGWMPFAAIVRAEFLRSRELGYVRSARALGASNLRIITVHILPNAVSSLISYVPFIINGAIITLAGLDFLGFGLPSGETSLGQLLFQGKRNLQAPWLGLSGAAALAVLSISLVFIGEGVRDAFNPKRARA